MERLTSVASGDNKIFSPVSKLIIVFSLAVFIFIASLGYLAQSSHSNTLDAPSAASQAAEPEQKAESQPASSVQSEPAPPPKIGPPSKTSNFYSGEVVGRIVIPSVGVDSALLQMAHVDDQPPLDRGPCHLGKTALPGQAGNCVLAGHRSTFTRPFYRLGELKPGDLILLYDNLGREYGYVVDRSLVVSPNDVWVMDPTPGPTVTLITCHPIGSGRYRLIIKGHLVHSR